MKLALATVATLMLLAAPVLAATDERPRVWHWPQMPAELPQQPGSVLVQVSIRGAVGWAMVDGFLVAPPDAGPTVCGPMTPKGAG